MPIKDSVVGAEKAKETDSPTIPRQDQQVDLETGKYETRFVHVLPSALSQARTALLSPRSQQAPKLGAESLITNGNEIALEASLPHDGQSLKNVPRME